MSRLDELIQELCPNGVKYEKLGDIASYSNIRINALEVDQDNYIGVDNLLPEKQGKTIAAYVPTEGSIIKYETGDVLIGNIRPYLKKIWLADRDGGTNGDVLTLQIKDRVKISPKYLYYVLSSEDFFYYDVANSKGAKMPRGNKEMVLKFRIPVPPLPVQEEVVRILDTFTERTTELTTELTARKKQYEYYRFTFLENTGNSAPKMQLKDLARVFRGEGITRKGSIAGNIPVILGGQEPAYYINKANHNGEVVVVSRSGASAGFVSYWNEAIFITDGFGFEADENVIRPKYLYYALKARQNNLHQMKRGAGIPHVNRKMLEEIWLLVPDLKEQDRIVRMLDEFDELNTNMLSGLPAEISARQKQYEYYRDKLLDFKELKPEGDDTN